ncbi:unnamed protein product [Amoebophrya sp. A120]|nr:unnamed protein product [Amoebophrya sp. A120]|eukprot:GSA120T00017973001.1
MTRMYSPARSFSSLQHQNKYQQQWAAGPGVDPSNGAAAAAALQTSKSAARQQRDFTNALICLSFLILVNLGLSLASLVVSLYAVSVGGAACPQPVVAATGLGSSFSADAYTDQHTGGSFYSGTSSTAGLKSSNLGGGGSTGSTGGNGNGGTASHTASTSYRSVSTTRGGTSSRSGGTSWEQEEFYYDLHRERERSYHSNGIHVDSRGGIYITPKNLSPGTTLYSHNVNPAQHQAAGSAGAVVGAGTTISFNGGLEQHGQQQPQGGPTAPGSTTVGGVVAPSSNPTGAGTSTNNVHNGDLFVQQKSTLIVEPPPTGRAPAASPLGSSSVTAGGSSSGGSGAAGASASSNQPPIDPASINPILGSPRIMAALQQNTVVGGSVPVSSSANPNGQHASAGAGGGPKTMQSFATSASSPVPVPSAPASALGRGAAQSPDEDAASRRDEEAPTSTGGGKNLGEAANGEDETNSGSFRPSLRSATEASLALRSTSHIVATAATASRSASFALSKNYEAVLGQGFDREAMCLRDTVLTQTSSMPQLALIQGRVLVPFSPFSTATGEDVLSSPPTSFDLKLTAQNWTSLAPGVRLYSGSTSSVQRGDHGGRTDIEDSDLLPHHEREKLLWLLPFERTRTSDGRPSPSGQRAARNPLESREDSDTVVATYGLHRAPASFTADVLLFGSVKAGEAWFHEPVQSGDPLSQPASGAAPAGAAGRTPTGTVSRARGSTKRGTLLEIFSAQFWPGVDPAVHDFLLHDSDERATTAVSSEEGQSRRFQEQFGMEVVTRADAGGWLALRIRTSTTDQESDAHGDTSMTSSVTTADEDRDAWKAVMTALTQGDEAGQQATLLAHMPAKVLEIELQFIGGETSPASRQYLLWSRDRRKVQVSERDLWRSWVRRILDVSRELLLTRVYVEPITDLLRHCKSKTCLDLSLGLRSKLTTLLPPGVGDDPVSRALSSSDDEL